MMTLTELRQQVADKAIVAGITANGEKHRFFIATDGNLCKFRKGSSRRGYHVNSYDMEHFVKFVGKKPEKTVDAKLREEYKVIGKYKKLANEATFSNNFIRDCQALPSFEDWLNDWYVPTRDWEKSEPKRRKNLCDYGITTGTSIEGKVITLDRIAKQYPQAVKNFREALKDKKEVRELGYGSKFAGYDISMSTQLANDEKDIHGFLNLEYAGCGNGNYYILINDNNFIGYDID
jgi:hypothetical protein